VWLDTLEHEDWGYCRTMTASKDRFDLREIDRDLGTRFVAFDRTGIKYYPVGAEVLGAIDNINRLKTRHGLSPSNVERITVGTPTFFRTAEGHEFPQSLSQVHFNIEYGIAMALVHEVRPVHESSAVLRQWMSGYEDATVRTVAGRVEHVTDEALDRRNPYGIDSRIQVVLRDGSVLEAETEYVAKAGSAGTMQFAPMEQRKIVAKFCALTEDAFSVETANGFANAVLGMYDTRDATELWLGLSRAVQDRPDASLR
jgi:aconitate decarboxylase